jgi:hypothetical protein
MPLEDEHQQRVVYVPLLRDCRLDRAVGQRPRHGLRDGLAYPSPQVRNLLELVYAVVGRGRPGKRECFVALARGLGGGTPHSRLTAGVLDDRHRPQCLEERLIPVRAERAPGLVWLGHALFLVFGLFGAQHLDRSVLAQSVRFQLGDALGWELRVAHRAALQRTRQI